MIWVQEVGVGFFALFKFFSLCVRKDFLKDTGWGTEKYLLLFKLFALERLPMLTFLEKKNELSSLINQLDLRPCYRRQ